MENNFVGVFDSGRGGLAVLSELQKEMPWANYFYYGDNKNCPYGEKSQEELEKITSDVVEFLISQKNTKIIVIACNTATTRCIDFLRKKFPNVTFVGTEPAIKLAKDRGFRKILVLGTPATAQSRRVAELISENSDEKREFRVLGCNGLADAIEREDDMRIDEILSRVFANMEKDFDAVVLGCTHYCFVREKIQKFFPNAEILDGNISIARRVKEILSKEANFDQKTPGETEFLWTRN